jgi:YD repeat-containing protein
MMSKLSIRKAAYVALLLVVPRITHASTSTVSAQYTYDQLGRVATALYDNGTCIAYTYDANGNRTAQTFTTSGTPASPVWGSGVWGCFPWTAMPTK